MTNNRVIKRKADCVKIAETILCNQTDIDNNKFAKLYGVSVDEQRRILDSYGLWFELGFSIYPVFIELDNSEISICSLSMAIMILYRRLKIEDRLNGNKKIDSIVLLAIKKALNTLVLLAEIRENERIAYWPTSVCTSNETQSGTFNQTSLALSCLNMIGFVDKENCFDSDKLKDRPNCTEIFECRYKLVLLSLNWILKNATTKGTKKVWSYGVDYSDSDIGVEYAILPSTFCYEVLKKFIIKYNSEDNKEFNSYVSFEFDNMFVAEMNETCNRYEDFILSEITDRNSHGGVHKDSIDESYSFLHTCLATVIFTFKYNDTDFEWTADFENAFHKCVSFITHHFREGLSDTKTMFEQYYFECQYETSIINTDNNMQTKSCTTAARLDTYEIIGEYVMISYIYKLLKYCDKHLKKNEKSKLKEILYYSFKQLDRRVVLKKNKGVEEIRIKGSQVGWFRYPIYGLYDAQLCYNIEVEHGGRVYNYPFKLYLVAIITVFLSIAIFILALEIGMVDTLVSLFLSVLNILFLFFAKRLFPRLGNILDDFMG